MIQIIMFVDLGRDTVKCCQYFQSQFKAKACLDDLNHFEVPYMHIPHIVQTPNPSFFKQALDTEVNRITQG